MLQPKIPRLPYILLILSCLAAAKAVAQQPDDPLSIYSFNQKYLEHLIKEKVDSVRIAHGLKPLYNDSILYVAAKFHGEYLFNKKDLSHTEPENPVTETPQKRADHFGAVNYLVGENLAMTVVGLPVKGKKGPAHTNSTYNQTATDFAIMWVNSPGHYKNMITPDYNATGVAIRADTKTNRIYAVQKFANILYKYTFDESKAFFSYSNFKAPPVATSFEGVERRLHKGKHAHKLKTPAKASHCSSCDSNSTFHFGLSHLEVKNGKILYSSYDLEPIFHLLKKKKDGFAVEIVPYTPYDCGNPAYYTDATRRNGQCVFSGRVLKPVYRKKALKGFRAGEKRKKIKKKLDNNKVKKYQVSLGKLPKDMTSFAELNLVIVQKKRVCRVLRFSGYCGDTLERFYTLPLYLDSIPPLRDIKEVPKNVSFTIPFQKGKTEYNMKDIKPVTDSLLSENFTADTLIIRAYSSVEGSEMLNHKLQEERAGHISQALAANQKEKLITLIASEENWTLFEKQIQEKEALKEFRNLSHDKIKALLDDSLKQKKYEPFLKEQRMARIRLKARLMISGKNVETYLSSEIKKHKKKISKLLEDESKKDQLKHPLDSMELLMSVACLHIQKKTIKPEFFKNFSLGNSPLLNSYNLNRMRYMAWLDSSGIHNLEWSRGLYDGLVNLYNNKKTSFFINYNMLMLIERYGKEMSVQIQDEQMDNYLEELKRHCSDSVQSALAQKLEINTWFRICRQTIQEVPKEKQALHSKYLFSIYNYYKDKTLSLSEKNKLASYYVYHSQAEWALELLWPDYLAKTDNPEGLVLLSKILYENYEETRDSSYYEFLKEIHARIGTKRWCPMFIGPCNISFQALDYEPFRQFYCEQCSTFLNYAKAPQEEKK